jgi:hypothetical protein
MSPSQGRAIDVDIYSIKGGEAPLDGMADKNNELNQIFLRC